MAPSNATRALPLLLLLLALVFVALLPAAWSCAVPHGGCLPATCAKYSKVTPSGVMNQGNYTAPATWLKGSLPYIGYYVGLYNRYWGGTYNTSGVPGSPALNYERFNLEINVTDPRTGKPYATPSTETNLVDCCNKCAKTDSCYLFQFFYGSPQNGTYCFLLSGGTSDYTDFPTYGVPFSGTHSQQNPGGSQYNVPLSFIGGRCDGTPGVTADPHFTGAHGVRFDFNGQLEKSFCLTADRSIQVNALLRGYKDTRTEGATVTKDGKALRTWIREVAVLWKDARGFNHSLHLVARAGKQQERGSGFLARVALDGRDQGVKALAAPGAGVKAADMALAFVGATKKGTFDVEQYRLTVGDSLDMSLSLRVAIPRMQTEKEAWTHFNLVFNSLKTSEKVHGVLGQTYRNSAAQIAKAVKYSEISRVLGGNIQADGESGKGFLDGSMMDYVTPSIIQPGCRFSPF